MIDVRLSFLQAWALRDIAWAVLFCLPVFAAYALHWWGSIGHPTGFLQGDQAYYMANARQYLDAGTFFPMYSLPFSTDAASPRIYFQPLIAGLAILLGLTGWDPGVIYTVCGCLAAVFMCLAALTAFRAFVRYETRGFWWVFLLFFWGGGMLCLAGMLDYWLTQPAAAWPIAYRKLFVFDPGSGYWFLNLGRNAIYTTEALYHALVLLLVVALARRRWSLAVVFLALISASTPFTGLMTLLAVVGWCLMEFRYSPQKPPIYFVCCAAALLMFHLFYYMVLLGAVSTEHVQLEKQWALNFSLPWVSSILAMGSLALLTVIRYVRFPEARQEILGTSGGRLLVAMAVVTIMLSHHELFISPRQPIHFDRGYAWLALFLLNARCLTRWVTDALRRPVTRPAVALVLVLGIMDNALWFSQFPLRRIAGKEPFAGGITLTDAEFDALRALKDGADHRALLVTSNENVAYLATVYTPLRSWHSHPFNTPWYQQRKAEANAAFSDGRCVREWEQSPTIYLQIREQGFMSESVPCNSNLVVSSPRYVVYTNFSSKSFDSIQGQLP